MKSGNIIREIIILAIHTVKIVRKIQEEKKEFVLSNQLLKSATSLGANIEEAIGGQSRKDFFVERFNVYLSTNWGVKLLIAYRLRFNVFSIGATKPAAFKKGF